MKKKQWVHAGILSLSITVLLSCSGIGNAAAIGVTDAQQEKEHLEQELKEARELINGLKESEDNIEDAVKELDEKLQKISRRISKLEEELTAKQEKAQETEEELKAAEADREKQYEDMKLRIQFLYENRSTSPLEKLLSSGSIAEFLNSAEYIAQISQYDRNMLVKYEETVESITHMEQNLRIEIADLEKMKQQVEQEQKTVGAMIQEKEHTLAETQGEITDAQQVADAYEAEVQAQNEIIAQIQAAEAERIRREQEAAAQPPKDTEPPEETQPPENTERPEDTQPPNDTEPPEDIQPPQKPQPPEDENTEGEDKEGEDTEKPKPNPPAEAPVGKFTWPCPSSQRITSDYGPRNSPTAGASSYHKGIDVGAAHGADIVAAADGDVVFAGYSNSAGNYIMISHGGGLYTVYMHCSSLSAATGQSVSRGQVIAKVGSTGISTGNHLHFGVSLNGSYVNPWGYL